MERLFGEDFVRRVAALGWLDMRRGAQAGSGALRDAPGAQGFDFAGHRPYGAGEDLRSLDWNALARLDEPVIRRFRDAAPREARFAIDRSPSMQFGEPTKDVMARRVAGALGILAMANGAAVGVAGDRLTTRTPASWLARLEGLGPGGEFLPRHALQERDTRGEREWFVLCDPYELASVRKLLTVLRSSGARVSVVIVTSREDRDPPERDAIVLDSETSEKRTYTSADADEFVTRRDALMAAWRLAATREGASLTEVDSRQGWESAAAAVLASRASARRP